MSVTSSPARQMSWHKPRQRVSLLAELALKRESVSRKLAELREQHSPDGRPLAQEKAAALVGVSMRQWQRWEAGESVPYPRNLGMIADAFGFDVSEFYDDTDRPDLKLVAGNADKLDLILAELGRARDERLLALADLEAARVERAAMQRIIETQNELLERQEELLAKMEARLMALEAVDRALASLEARDGEGQPERRTRPANGA